MNRFAFLVVAVATCHCGRDDAQLNCDDLLPASEVSYSALAAIVTDTGDPRNCASCHNSEEPLYNLNLETPDTAYFDLRDRIDRIYANVATGEMPDEGLQWSDDDVRLLRSWYCLGALDD